MAVAPASVSKVVVRATNWLGDAVMSLPAIRAIRHAFPSAHLTLAARPWVADLYARESAIDQIILYAGSKGFQARRELAARLREEGFECAILLQNAFDAGLVSWMAGIPERIGYRSDGRGWLLTEAIPVPEPGDIPRHERFYYLELLRRAGWIRSFPPVPYIRLEGAEAARESGERHLAALGMDGEVIGISPGAAYGNAKRWLPERFVEAAGGLSQCALIFGSAAERPLCEQVARLLERRGISVRNLAGETSLREFIDLSAACRLFLTNDSGAMHVASALGVPTVAVFGATDDAATGPTGPFARVVREHAECSPCLLRECPIDHRCMTRVTADPVVRVARELWEESAPAWTHAPKL
jgi:heptosyltransferase II